MNHNEKTKQKNFLHATEVKKKEKKKMLPPRRRPTPSSWEVGHRDSK